MKIFITDPACGLELNEQYDLCDMSAKTLIEKGQAVAVRKIVINNTTAEPKKPKPIDPEMLKCQPMNKDKPTTKKTAKRKNK